MKDISKSIFVTFLHKGLTIIEHDERRSFDKKLNAENDIAIPFPFHEQHYKKTLA